MFDTFPDFGKNGEPFESIVNSSQIEGRAVGKSTKKRSKTDGNTVKKRRRKSDVFFAGFALLVGGIWKHFGNQNAIKNRVKNLMRFWRPNQANKPVIWGRFGGMRGGIGEDPPPPFGGAGRDKIGLSNSVEISTERGTPRLPPFRHSHKVLFT